MRHCILSLAFCFILTSGFQRTGTSVRNSFRTGSDELGDNKHLEGVYVIHETLSILCAMSWRILLLLLRISLANKKTQSQDLHPRSSKAIVNSAKNSNQGLCPAG